MADEVFGSGELRTTRNPRVGVLMRNSWGKRQFRFSEIDGVKVIEGDIIIGRGLELEGVAIVGPGVRWPEQTVVYEIDPDLPHPGRVTDAIAHWNAKTVIQLMIVKNLLRTFSWFWTAATPGAFSNWLVTFSYWFGSLSCTRRLCGMSPTSTLPAIGLLRNCSLKRSYACCSDS